MIQIGNTSAVRLFFFFSCPPGLARSAPLGYPSSILPRLGCGGLARRRLLCPKTTTYKKNYVVDRGPLTDKPPRGPGPIL